MKPQFLPKVTSQNVFIRLIDTGMKQNLKTIYPPVKLKQSSVIFILNHINYFIDPTKIYMTFLIPKIFRSNYSRYKVHLLDFCLLHYFVAI